MSQETDQSTCAACGVTIHPHGVYRHSGKSWHPPCLVRSLQADLDIVREKYERLRPHVSDRSVLRGLGRFADHALESGRLELGIKVDEDAQNAIDWLRQAAGWSPP